MALSLAEKLMHTTVRLECQLRNGRSSTGRGFFFSFKVDDIQTVPLIITNRHVIKSSLNCRLALTMRDEDGGPITGSHEVIKLEVSESDWAKHPDPNVDLAALPIASLLHAADRERKSIFFLPLEESLIPSPEAIGKLSGIEDIVMIGYPNGIWDARNNMPIVRMGITATSPKHDYNGLPLFVIDCACFPGSSGSPIMIFNQGSYADSEGNLNVGNRVIFLGVLFAGPQHTAEGEVQTIDVPLQQLTISLSRIPNNLGFAIKSQRIKDFREIFLPPS